MLHVRAHAAVLRPLLQPCPRSHLFHPHMLCAAGGGSLLQQMRQRLQGGRFRWLNETLYTSDGSEALRLMSEQPELMEQYHEGERRAEGWGGSECQ